MFEVANPIDENISNQNIETSHHFYLAKLQVSKAKKKILLTGIIIFLLILFCKFLHILRSTSDSEKLLCPNKINNTTEKYGLYLLIRESKFGA